MQSLKIIPVDASRIATASSDAIRPVAAEAKRLSRISTTRSFAELGSTWLQIAGLLTGYAVLQTWWTFLIAFILVGARQYGLLILLHDASHSLLHPRRKLNDFLALWFLAAPCGSSFFNSRRLHLLHHQNLGKGTDDPDFFFYSSGPPFQKDTRSAFLMHFVKLLLNAQVFHTLFNVPAADSPAKQPHWRNIVIALVPVVIVQTLFLSIFAIAGIWYAYFLLWVLPLLTLAVFFNGARTFADHANVGGDVGGEQGLLVTYSSNPFERFFIAPYHMNYHAEHHHFPFVPHYNLPKVRELLHGSANHRQQIQWRGSYVAFIWRYFRALHA